MPDRSVARFLSFGLPLLLLAAGGPLRAEESAAVRDWREKIEPILSAYCYDCHADGGSKGDVSFDTFASAEELVAEKSLWLRVLKNVRGGIMPPPKRDQLEPEEFAQLEEWIVRDAFGHDPANPDPGRVTLRRLNRVEYRNTIRDLMGVDFRTDEEFPADDSGYGFDNIGDVLTVSPMLLEKYMQAAARIVEEAVPLNSRVVPERRIGGQAFRNDEGRGRRPISLSLYDKADLSHEVTIDKAGTWRVVFDSAVRDSFDFDPGRARLTVFVDGEQAWQDELVWGAKDPAIALERKWDAGRHTVRFTLEPLTNPDEKPGDRGEGRPFVDFELRAVALQGPMEREHWLRPDGYDRFFPREDPPVDRAEWPPYLREVLTQFATRAFRRPVDAESVDRLAAIAQSAWDSPEATFEAGAARAMTAVLASPRFLFRMEHTLPADEPGRHPLLDEYSLASRLSYFLWSTMPDDELMALATRGELRSRLDEQVRRLVANRRRLTLAENFAGQWLHTRDVMSVSINGREVSARDAGSERDVRRSRQERRRLDREIDAAREAGDQERVDRLQKELNQWRERFLQSRREFTPEIRRAMLLEAQLFFEDLVAVDGSVLDLLDSDYTFLNGPLAEHYDIPGVEGEEMRRVKLPEGSSRGGVLTMGAVLAVTSNATRTSPVKRGMFVLDNLLGLPPAPPPPDIPALEDVENRFGGREPTLRETLALHRESSMCASCHNRMDPLGLAFENFNAMGRWRDAERGQPIEHETGRLITGEEFGSIRELKKVLRNQRHIDFYRNIVEKLLTYALGRGMEPCDVPAVDAIVERLDRENGRFSALLSGIVESVPFQRRRADPPDPADPRKTAGN